jgi:uncharacterized protein YjiS (DUF1127 family)
MLPHLLASICPNLLSFVRIWHARASERRSLSELDDHLLLDLGLSRERVNVESTRPFWSGIARERVRGLDQERFTAFSEKESGSRGSSSGRRKRRGSSAGTIFGNNR